MKDNAGNIILPRTREEEKLVDDLRQNYYDLVLKSKLVRVVIGVSGDTVFGTFLLNKKKIKLKMAYNPVLMLAGDPTPGTKTWKDLIKIFLDLLDKDINPQPSKQNFVNEERTWLLKKVVLETKASKEYGAIKDHIQKLIEEAQAKTRELVLAKEPEKKQKLAKKRSATVKLRRIFLTALASGMEFPEVEELWKECIVKSVLNS